MKFVLSSDVILCDWLDSKRQLTKWLINSVPWLIGSSRGQEGRFSRDPLPVFFCRKPLWAILVWAGISTLWYCQSSIFLCRPRRHQSPKVPRRMVLSSLSWSVTYPNHARFLTVARRGSWEPTGKLICSLLKILCPAAQANNAWADLTHDTKIRLFRGTVWTGP